MVNLNPLMKFKMKTKVTSLLLILTISGCANKSSDRETFGEVLENRVIQARDTQKAIDNKLASLMVADRSVSAPGWLFATAAEDSIEQATLHNVSKVTVRLEDGDIITLELDHYTQALKQGDKVSVTINHNDEPIDINALIAKKTSSQRDLPLLYQRNTHR